MSVIEGKGVQTKLHLRLPSQSHQHVARVPLGTTFQKFCDGEGTLVGTLIAFNPVQDLYEIRYNDDDVEELTWVDLNKLLRVTGDTVTAPRAVPPLCQEAPTTMTQAAALQLQQNLLAKGGHNSSSTVEYAIVESTMATVAAQGLKSVQVRPSSAAAFDSTVCGGTLITAHSARRTAMPVELAVPEIHVPLTRKSPRNHVPSAAMLNIALQFASSESESNAHVKGMIDETEDSASIESSSESGEEFIASKDTDELLSSSSSDDDDPAVVVPNDKAKKKRLQQVTTLLPNILYIESRHSGLSFLPPHPKTRRSMPPPTS